MLVELSRAPAKGGKGEGGGEDDPLGHWSGDDAIHKKREFGESRQFGAERDMTNSVCIL